MPFASYYFPLCVDSQGGNNLSHIADFRLECCILEGRAKNVTSGRTLSITWITLQRPPQESTFHNGAVFSFVHADDLPIFAFLRYTGCGPNEAEDCLVFAILIGRDGRIESTLHPELCPEEVALSGHNVFRRVGLCADPVR